MESLNGQNWDNLRINKNNAGNELKSIHSVETHECIMIPTQQPYLIWSMLWKQRVIFKAGSTPPFMKLYRQERKESQV